MSKVCGDKLVGGLEISAGFCQVNNEIFMELDINNILCALLVSSLVVQLNKNSF